MYTILTAIKKKKPGVARLIRYKADFRVKNVTRCKEDYCIKIKNQLIKMAY